MQFDEYEEQKKALAENARDRRGTKWKRKPKQDGKPYTRRPSAREAERADDVVREIVQAQALDLPEKDQEANDALLRGEYRLETKGVASPASLIKRILESDNRQQVITASRRYLKAIIYAYAIYLFIVSRDKFALDVYARNVSEKTGIPLNLKFDLLVAVCQLAIDYERGKKGTDHRRKWSRDAHAIRWLIKEGIQPHQVLEYQKQHGGGVDKWSRLASEEAKTAQQKQEVSVTAAMVERDRADDKRKSEAADKYMNDIPETEDELDRHQASREQNRLRYLADNDPWLEGLLYAARSKGLKPGEGMVILLAGDESAIGARHIGSYSIGALPDSSFSKRQVLLEAWRAAKKYSRMIKSTEAEPEPNGSQNCSKKEAQRVWG